MAYKNLHKLVIMSSFSTLVIVVYLLLQEDSPSQQYEQTTFNHGVVIDPSKTYAKFDRSLCEFQQPEKTYYVGKKPCPRHVVTVKQGGRLCNQIWEYLAVWAAAKRTGFEPYVPTCLYNSVAAMYDSLTVGRFEEIAHCPLNENSFVTSKFGPWNKRKNLIFPIHATEPDLILDYSKDFSKELVLRQELVEESQRQLGLLKVPNNTVYVGVHIRKTDYDAYLKVRHGMEPADNSFYEKAMAAFEEEYELVLFVLISDDPDWCYENFGKRKNVHVIGYGRNNSAEIDLAILSSCNHTIFDYGSYGAWGAVVAGGKTIYYKRTKGIAALVGKKLKWTKL